MRLICLQNKSRLIELGPIIDTSAEEQWFFAQPQLDMSFSSIKELYWVCEGSDEKSQIRQLKASPGIETPRFHCGWYRLQPRLGNLSSFMSCGAARKIKTCPG